MKVKGRDAASRHFPVWERCWSPIDKFLRPITSRVRLRVYSQLGDSLVTVGRRFFWHRFSGEPTRALLRFLDWLAEHTLPPEKIAAHHRTGRRGEEAAYFHLRKLGYTMVARNFRSPRCRGEIDLIGWEDHTLCFVEVKTRTTRDVKPAEAAVDRHKRREVAAVAREFLRRFPPSCQWRFDVVSVYYPESEACQPRIEVFRNSSLRA